MFEDSITNIYGGGAAFGLDYSDSRTITSSGQNGKFVPVKSPVDGIALIHGNVSASKIDYNYIITVLINSLAVFSSALVKGENSIPIYVNKEDSILLETNSTAGMVNVCLTFIPYLTQEG